MQVPLINLKRQYSVIKDEIRGAIDEVIESQCFILGSKVEEFEMAMANYNDVKGAIGVSSGTDAILLALMALGVGEGDEVITSSFSFGATVGSIQRLGAVPVFVDIIPETYNINPDLIEKSISENTKAIEPVHIYGQCADLDPIVDVAEKYNLKVVEDAAQAVGAEYKGRKAGSIGDLGCFSFFPTKNLGAYGDGGMVTSNSDAYIEEVKTLRVHGSKDRYYYSKVGINGRLDAIQAAVLNVKLRYLDKWCDMRRERAAYYNEKLGDVPVELPEISKHSTHIFHQYVIRSKNRDELFAYLTEHEISCGLYYPLPLHLQESLKCFGYKDGDLPETERAAKETLALPIFPELTVEEQDYVVDTVKNFYSEN
ncbi:MAG: DegT/DnrJ/EryC1/StrS family aminotransferase [Candidatus Anammoxibacter sp.]